MGLFSSSSNKKYTELVCDISNGSVGVALVSHTPGVVAPNIIFNERIFSTLKQKEDIKNTISAFNKDLMVLLNTALRHCVNKGFKPYRVSCFYSSPWFISETNNLKIKQLEPVFFTESIIKKMLEEGERGFLSGEAVNNNFLPSDNLKLIERRITRIKLNGYKTHNPIGKKTSDIELALFLSAVPKEILSSVEETIDRIWHKVKICHHTFPLASFSMLRNEFVNSGNFLVVHISENITDISIISDDMLLDTFSFPLGRRNVVENIENKCNLDYELASSALSMYTKGEINSEHSKRFGDAVDSVKKDWMTHFENACSVLTKETSIPSSIYLIADSKISSFFESTIREFGFVGYAMSDKELKICPVSRDIFSKYLSYAQPSPHKDFFLETEVLYTDLISTKEEKIIDNYILE